MQNFLAPWLWRWLPRGRTLPDEVWWPRHRGIQVLLWAHVPVIFVFALAQDPSVAHALFEATIPAGFALLARATGRSGSLGMVVTSVGLMTCSAVFVHLTDGLIEMHFHYFVMVGVITLYQSWPPFLIAIGWVVVQHGVAGMISPEAVYNHPAAIESPWKWAGIHGAFILAMSVAGIINWRLNETLLGEAREREHQLEEAQELLNATLDSTADGILVVGRDGSITGHNTRFTEMWRIPDELMSSGDHTRRLGFVLDQVIDPDAFVAKVQDLYAHPEAESHGDTIQFHDGRVYERSSRPQRVRGEVVGRVWSFRDVTEHAHLQLELTHRALHDPLTELANQTLFRDRLDHALERSARHAQPLAVLFLDLDDFKNVNDSFGHRVGDELLVEVGERIRSCLRVGDTAARLGGDEFAVLLEDLASLDEAVVVAERLLASLVAPFTLMDREFFVSASVGIAESSSRTGSDQLLRNADLAMYAAKRSGKNRHELFVPAMHTAALERSEVESDLRRALERDEIVVVYQPIVSVATRRIVGVEALARWQHPERGLLGPEMFIPFAEQSGLIDVVGHRVLELACLQMRQWQLEQGGQPLALSVNVAPRQLRDPGIVDLVAATLERAGLEGHHLVLEITEGAMMQDTELALERLTLLKALGLRLAVDDFGTGHSSLSYLQQFPIDILKVDRSFVARIDEGPEESALARSIVRLASTLQLSAVAEGVETASQLERLREIACPLAQGYHLCPPVDADAISHILSEQAMGRSALRDQS